MRTSQIRIGMGEGVVARGPHIVMSAGIGSCVVVTLYDDKRQLGAMAHVMLPDSAALPEPSGSFQCADTAIRALVDELRKQGSLLENLVAKMVGGARMFPCYNDGHTGIGHKALQACERFFIELQHTSADWLALTTTKTGAVYRLNGNPPQAHE